MEGRAVDPQSGATPKVLLFSVDDALLGLHLDWVEAILSARSTDICHVSLQGDPQSFVVYRGEPAFVVEPRVLFGLAAPSGSNGNRAAHLLLRSGSHLLALRIDECVGVQEVDLHSHPPIASALLSDGGVPLGHLLEVDGRIVTIVDPSRLLDGGAREHLARAAREARSFLSREAEIAALWGSIRETPSSADIRKYVRLCKRNGWTHRARAARAVCKAATVEDEHSASAEPLLALLLRLERGRESAGIAVEDAAGDFAGRIAVSDGRIAEVALAGEEVGIGALAALLAMRDARARLEAADGDLPSASPASTTAAAIEALAYRAERRASTRE
jgi:chemotaxis signal transduction protein